MGQAEVVVAVVQGELLVQARFALAQGGDASADRRNSLGSIVSTSVTGRGARGCTCVAEAEGRRGRIQSAAAWSALGVPGGASAGVGTAAGGTSVPLRARLPWVLLPTRVTFPALTTLSL